MIRVIRRILIWGSCGLLGLFLGMAVFTGYMTPAIAKPIPKAEPNMRYMREATLFLSGITNNRSRYGTAVYLGHKKALTAGHLCKADQIRVKTVAGTVAKALTKIFDETIDLCILTLNRNLTDAAEVQIGNVFKEELGKRVVIVGFPNRLETYSTGISEVISEIYALTMAPTYYGSSGSGVFTINNKLIGIVSKIQLLIEEHHYRTIYVNSKTIKEFLDKNKVKYATSK